MSDTSMSTKLNSQPFAEHDSQAMMRTGFWVTLLTGAACLGLGFLQHDGYRRFLHAYLWACSYFLTISLGALFFVALQHLARAAWSIGVRRIAELVAATSFTIACLYAPILISMAMGDSSLYPWVNQHVVMHDHLLRGKTVFLNVPFFIIRFGLYAVIWRTLSQFFLRESQAQDSSARIDHTAKMQFFSPLAIILFALSITFAAFDTLMSLDPHWYSTMFGVYIFAGSMVSFLSVLIVLVQNAQHRGYLSNIVTTEHYHDLGKLLFGFVFFWGYIAFSQFMLIWYGNLPEETKWFWVREQQGWQWLGLTMVVGHFALPFIGLLSRHVKRYQPGLRFWAIWLLAMHAVDLYWVIAPTLSEQLYFGGLEACAFLAVGGIFVATLGRLAHLGELCPINDPRLSEALSFENI